MLYTEAMETVEWVMLYVLAMGGMQASFLPAIYMALASVAFFEVPQLRNGSTY